MDVAIASSRSYNVRMPKKKLKVAPMAFRFTEDAAWLLERCAENTGESKASLLERIIRAEARRLGVRLADKPQKDEATE